MAQILKPESKHINLKLLYDHAGDDVNFLKEILELFVSEMSAYLEEFHAFVISQKWIDVSKQAHKMKSPILLFDAQYLYGVFTKLEYSCKDESKSTREFEPLLREAEDLTRTIITEVEIELKKIT